MQIAEIYKRLCRVNKFTVEVTSENKLFATGEGHVNVENETPGIVTWREHGHWDRRLNSVEFNNVYRWSSLHRQALGLEHLRYGDNQPVQLVELVKNSSRLWVCRCPHKCGQDRYRLSLEIKDDELTMVWQITGPNKNQVSRVCYA